MLFYSYHLSGPAYPLVRARYVKMSTAIIKKKKRRRKNEREKKKETKGWKWEMTENAQVDNFFIFLQVDNENNWALLRGHFLKSIAMWKAQL